MTEPTYGGFWTPDHPLMQTAATAESSGWEEWVDRIKEIIKNPPY